MEGGWQAHLVIREATAADISAVCALLWRAYQESPYAHVPADRLELQRKAAVYAASPAMLALVAERGGDVVGVLLGNVAETLYGHRCAVCQAVYAPGGTGAGVRLMRAFVARARAAGLASAIFQTSQASDDARFAGLARHLGAVPSGSLYEVIL